MTPTITIGEQRVSMDSVAGPKAQSLLWSLRRLLQYPRCNCALPHRPLQLRRLGDTLHLAVWPGDGVNHTLDCVFYRTRDVEQRIHALGQQVAEDDESGTWSVSIDRGEVGPVPARERRTSVSPRMGATATAPTRKASRRRRTQPLDLEGWLTWLWHEARLAQWQAHWRRDWGRVVWELERLLAHGRIDRVPASELVLVVPPYRGPVAAEHGEDGGSPLARREQWLSRLRRSDPTRPGAYGLLIGEIKDVDERPGFVKLQLRHFLHPLFADSTTWQAALPKTLAGDELGTTARRVICGRVDTTPRGNYRVTSMAILLCDEHYVPINIQAPEPASLSARGSIDTCPTN